MKHGMFKRNPNLIYQVDNMATNKCYEDKLIMISDRCIANKKATVDELADKIANVCPNVRFGYNDEGLAYLRQMKQMYKNNNGMIPYKGFVQNVFGNVQNNSGQGYDQNTFNQ